MESKKDIRKQLLEIRMEMDPAEWEIKSCRIYRQVISHPMFLNADAIYCYVDYKNEVGTKQIIHAALNLNKKVAVPRVSEDTMDFFYINQLSELVPGFRGIQEPQNEFVANDKNVLVIMPGSVFDKSGHRIGYGRGYYDRYLQEHIDYKTIALAFDFQVLDSIPSELHDIIPNVIITEEQIYDFKYSK